MGIAEMFGPRRGISLQHVPGVGVGLEWHSVRRDVLSGRGRQRTASAGNAGSTQLMPQASCT
jgi:hypothetical protein